jgi:hypothetical protein
VALEACVQNAKVFSPGLGPVGGDVIHSPHCASVLGSVSDPRQSAGSSRPGWARPSRADIDRRPDKRIDFCAEKLIDLLLALRTREPPAGGSGDRSAHGSCAPGKPRDPQHPGHLRASPSPSHLQAFVAAKVVSFKQKTGREEGPAGGTFGKGVGKGKRMKEVLLGVRRFPLPQGPSTDGPPKCPK